MEKIIKILVQLKYVTLLLIYNYIIKAVRKSLINLN